MIHTSMTNWFSMFITGHILEILWIIYRMMWIPYCHMPGSPHRQWADVLSPHQALSQLLTVHHALSAEAAWTLIHAFITSRVNYSNSIFGSTSAVHLRFLQCVLNAAARLIVKRRRPTLFMTSYTGYQSSTGIPTKYAFFVYKCLHGTAPSYLIEQFVPVAVNPARSSLWSASNRDLMYPRTNLVRYGQRSFSVIGPRTWNQLPPNIRDPSLSFDNFCIRLKTVLFNRVYYES